MYLFEQKLENILQTEAVRGRQITSDQELQIDYIDPEDDWESAAQVEQIANKVRIRPNRNKDVSIVARVGDTVIGGIFTAFDEEVNEDQVEQTLDFDIVVDPQWQGYKNVGLRLIEATIQYAQESDCSAVEAFVINKRLATVLDRKYGFDGIYQGWDGRAIKMIRWL